MSRLERLSGFVFYGIPIGTSEYVKQMGGRVLEVKGKVYRRYRGWRVGRPFGASSNAPFPRNFTGISHFATLLTAEQCCTARHLSWQSAGRRVCY